MDNPVMCADRHAERHEQAVNNVLHDRVQAAAVMVHPWVRYHRLANRHLVDILSTRLAQMSCGRTTEHVTAEGAFADLSFLSTDSDLSAVLNQCLWRFHTSVFAYSP